MPRRVLEPSDDVNVYLVLIDHGKNGIAYDETEPAEADLETTIRNFLTGRYENALRVAAFNTAEGWSQDVSEDIAQELLQRAINAGDDLGEGAQRFVDRHVAQHAPPMQLGAVELLDRLKADFEKRRPAPSVRRGPALDIRQRPAKPSK
jgi:hypothetical protein